MFGFFKKKEKEKNTAVSVEVKNKTPGGNGVVDAATGIAITDAARAATDNANAVYAKPTQYTVATAGYSMAVGQALIPIPVVGAAVGALVGSFATSSVYSQLIGALRSKQLQQQERERIIAECNKMVAQEQAYRAELEQYLESYFADYQHCFDEALGQIDSAMKSGDANGVIAGANAITRKLGGKVQFNNMDEFDKFLDDDTKTLF